MLVSVQQVPRFYSQATDLHRSPKLEDMSIGVGDSDVSGKELEACTPDLWQVADRAVCDYRHASQGPQNVGVHFADKRAKSGAFLDILDNHELAARLGREAWELAKSKYSYEAYLEKTRQACAALEDPTLPGAIVKDVA